MQEEVEVAQLGIVENLMEKNLDEKAMMSKQNYLKQQL
jgi:hypothetical protein